MSTETTQPEYKKLAFKALRNGYMCMEGRKCHWELSEDTMRFLVEHDEEVQPITGMIYDRVFKINNEVSYCIIWSVDDQGYTSMEIEVYDDSDLQYSVE